MLSFLHCSDYCCKCKFDTDVKIENCYHHDREKLGFHKKVHIKTESQKKDVLVIFILFSRPEPTSHLTCRIAAIMK